MNCPYDAGFQVFVKRAGMPRRPNDRRSEKIMLPKRHVTHLLTRYVHGQLRPAQRARVLNHVRVCGTCRAALAREERLAADLRREMPAFGQPTAAQLAGVWAGVWEQVGAPRQPRTNGLTWLPGLSMMLALALALALALPVLAGRDIRAEAAPMQPRPADLASPTPGATLTDEARPADRAVILPRATIALAVEMGASPVPMPAATVSPVAP
jgi:hypothetical protein